MEIKQLSNPGGAFGLTADAGSQEVILVVAAQAAGTLSPGDVVVWKDATCTTVATSTTASDTTVAGVVLPLAGGTGTDATTFAIGATVPICVRGLARVNVTGQAGVAVGTPLNQSATAKVATNTTLAASTIGSYFALPLEAYAARDANNTVRCNITRA